jgi:hypothetical protein
MPLTEGAGQTCKQDEKAAFQQAAQISPKPFVTGWFHNVPSIRTGGFQLCNIFARNDTLRLLVVNDWNCRVRSTMHIAPLLTHCVGHGRYAGKAALSTNWPALLVTRVGTAGLK